MNDILSVLRNRRATQSSCLRSHCHTHNGDMTMTRCLPGCLIHHLTMCVHGQEFVAYLVPAPPSNNCCLVVLSAQNTSF